jgi:hypothetical protein
MKHETSRTAHTAPMVGAMLSGDRKTDEQVSALVARELRSLRSSS